MKALLTHVVQPGENLWSIAARYGVSVQAIMTTNGILDPNMIFVGTVLRIPVSTPPSQPGPFPPAPPTPGGRPLDRRVEVLERQVNQLERRLDRQDRRIDNLENRVRKLEGR